MHDSEAKTRLHVGDTLAYSSTPKTAQGYQSFDYFLSAQGADVPRL